VRGLIEAVCPIARFDPNDPEYLRRKKEYRSLDLLLAALVESGVDLELTDSVLVQSSLTKDYTQNHIDAKRGLYIAPRGNMTARVDSREAALLVCHMFQTLSDTGLYEGDPFCRETVRDRMHITLAAAGGAENSMGRLIKAYPKKGSESGLQVPSVQEARDAVRRCGLYIQDHPKSYLRAWPLLPRDETGQGLLVNKHSSNGIPVGRSMSDPEAASICMGLAVQVRRDMVSHVRSGESVQDLYEEWMETAPYMVVCRGKAKEDNYKIERLKGAQMRFYNVLPRHLLLNVQVATQPLEDLCRSIHQAAESWTSQGITLTDGGADKLVRVLQERLDEYGYAYTHMGDDSWVIKRVGRKLVMFALDGSNFDLTQHSDVTLNAHYAIWEQLSLIDDLAADLWRCIMRKRLVILTQAVTAKMKHAGPSGAALQSKVNDVLMDICINRVLQADIDWINGGEVDELLQRVGKGLHFDIRVEQHHVEEVATIKEFLERRPFLYIGMYFHVLDGMVYPFTDLPRTMAQMRFPGLKWERSAEMFQTTEAMRLAALYVSAGVPPRKLEPLMEMWRETAIRLLEKSLRDSGDTEDPRLRWAVSESPFGPDATGSVSGLLDKLRHYEEKSPWRSQELPSTSVMIPVGSLSLWAEEVENTEAEAFGPAPQIPGETKAQARAIIRRPKHTHPTTMRNIGRRPPTAVWAPAKERREARMGPQQPAILRRRGNVLQEDFESDDYSVSDEWVEYVDPRYYRDQDEDSDTWSEFQSGREW